MLVIYARSIGGEEEEGDSSRKKQIEILLSQRVFVTTTYQLTGQKIAEKKYVTCWLSNTSLSFLFSLFNAQVSYNIGVFTT